MIPPSYFSNQGIPVCSVWGNCETECLAWAYVTGMARSGDTWRPVTPQECLDSLTQEERDAVGSYLRTVVRGFYGDRWEDVTSQLQSEEGAFSIGLSWSKRRYNQSQP